MGLRDAAVSLRGPQTSRRDVLASLVTVPILGRWLDEGMAHRLGSAQLTLTGDNEGDKFGGALAVDGQRALVGAAGAETVADVPTGAAHLFTRENGAWERTASFTPDRQNNALGASVDLDDTTAVVGDPLAQSSNGPGGTVTVYERQDGSWRKSATLTPSTPTGADQFGRAVALNGDTIIVGAAATASHEARGAGAVYVFTRSGSEWSQAARLTPGPEGRRFGTAVALDGDTAIVGQGDRDSPIGVGSAVVFQRAGGQWTRQALLSPADDRGEGFGTTLALAGDTLLVGAPGATADGHRAGAVFVFMRTGSGWQRQRRLRPPDPKPDDRFGRAVALKGDTAIVVAAGVRKRRAATARIPAGAAHLFNHTNGRWRWRGARTTGDENPTRGGTAAALGDVCALLGGLPIGEPPRASCGAVRVVER